MKKVEKIFITDNPYAQNSLKNDVMRALERCAKLEALLKDFGLPVTREIVTDCLTLRKDTESIPYEETTKWVGEKSVRFAREMVSVEVWRNSEHLQTAFDTMLAETDTQDARTSDIKRRKDTLKVEFDKLLEDIYGVFHINLLTISTDALLKYFDIKNDSIVLVSDFEERLKAETATYATKEESKYAFNLHREIAGKLNELADLLKEVDRTELANELDRLFCLSDDGRTIQASPIDYDLYT